MSTSDDQVVFCFLSFFFRYPVILSLENHCSLPNQKKMAEILEEKLGGILFVNSKIVIFTCILNKTSNKELLNENSVNHRRN